MFRNPKLNGIGWVVKVCFVATYRLEGCVFRIIIGVLSIGKPLPLKGKVQQRSIRANLGFSTLHCDQFVANFGFYKSQVTIVVCCESYHLPKHTSKSFETGRGKDRLYEKKTTKTKSCRFLKHGSCYTMCSTQCEHTHTVEHTLIKLLKSFE